ncbi:MAG TPA: hypothetical protein VF752_01285 [Thermoleophilaceae bacterium]
MTRDRFTSLVAGAALIPLTALAAGCGSSGSSTAATRGAAPSPAHASSARAATLRVANSRLGKILVDSQGRTLYLFKKDSLNKSACSGQCVTFWQPLRTSGKPVASSGVTASLLGTIKRSDGKSQVTYNGHPLYTFAMDHKAGDTNGEGVTAFNARWFAVSRSGKQVSPKAQTHTRGSTTAPAPKAATPAAPPKSAAPAAPKPPPAAKPPAARNGIPQNGGGDGDSDNNGGPDDGDGGV